MRNYRADINTPVESEPDWNCLDPWHQVSVEGAPESGNKRPDFLVLCRGRLVTRWVLDAKYKLRSGAQVDLSDRYQLFAYSHLAKVAGRPPRRGAILRPCRGTGGIRGSLIRADERFALDIVDLPFPKPDASLSDQAWSSSIERITNGLEELLDVGTLLNAPESTKNSAMNLDE